MKLNQFLYPFLVSSTFAQQIPPKDHKHRQYFAVESNLSIEELLRNHPTWSYEHDVRGLPQHFVFSEPIGRLQKRQDYSSSPDIKFFEDLPPMGQYLFKRPAIDTFIAIPREDAGGIGDKNDTKRPIDSSMIPILEAEERLEISNGSFFEKQWHLINPSFPGLDINVTDLWYENITGSGVVAAIVDDGLDYENPGLKDNFCEEGSWDFNDNTKLPKPRLSDDYHGTRCAGEIAAALNGGQCGIGVGFEAKVAGIRILSGELTTEDEAASLIYGLDVNDIYSCSWGPKDDGEHLQGPSPLVRKSLIKGIQDGRGGKGAIYVFASGNGGYYGDNCNYDGYTNSIFSITVGAIDHKGLHPPYSESCSAVLVVTYSSGSGEYIHTTDIKNRCSDKHGGTSAAAPLAAGVYTLLLQANPNLTWRDVQYLTILSSKEVKNSDADSQMGAMGKIYSHRYGYGSLDAYDLVHMAKDWKNVNPQSWYYSQTEIVEQDTNSTAQTLSSSIEVTEEHLKDANLKRLEHITVTVDIKADIRGYVTVDLISPSGMVSNLGVVREHDKSTEGFPFWTFMSVAHWGEDGIGEWKLEVKTAKEGNRVQFKNWRLKLFGESIDASKAVKFQLDTADDFETTTASLLGEPTSTGVNSIESSVTEQTAASQTTAGPTETMATSEMTLNTEEVGPSEIPEHNLPNMLSHPSQAMHYYLAIFAAGSVFLLLYFSYFVKSARRIRRSRAEAYEFDIIESDSELESGSEQNIDSHEPIPVGDPAVDDLDFDLSDEDNLPNSQKDKALRMDPNTIDTLLQDDPFVSSSNIEVQNNGDNGGVSRADSRKGESVKNVDAQRG